MSVHSTKVDMANRLNRNLGFLQAGATVTIDVMTPAGQKSKFRTVFIGYLQKQYVLIQFPEAKKLGPFGQYLTQGVGITVRGLIEGHEGAVVGFVSTIKQTIQIPSRLLVLEFPKSVSLQYLRSSKRIHTKIEAKVKFNNEYWKTVITDISITGCQLFISRGEKLASSTDKYVEVVIEDFEGMSNLKMMAKVCSIKKIPDGISIGLQFKDVSKKEVTKLLHHTITLED
ncbi:MAG: flagellar brake protein [Alteromonadaceae bacterium]|nr:flagellar brake protein [Alteromonadaceae bacterium]